MHYKSKRVGGAILSAAVALAALALPAAAAGEGNDLGRVAQTMGNEVRFSGDMALGDDYNPAVAFNATAGEYLVVWSDGRDPLAYDIRGRRMSAAGATLGPDFRISGPKAVSHETWPDVAWNATRNEYLVVWGDDRATGARGRDIYGRRLAANGAPIGKDFRISGPAATGWEYSPSVAWNAVANQYLVVWEDARNYDTRSNDIYGRRVTALGTVTGGDIQICGPKATYWDSVPDVAARGDSGEYLVVWSDERNFATGKGVDIYGRRVSSGGAKLAADFRINKWAPATQKSPAVAWNGNATEYLVVWQDARSYGTRDYDIYGRHIDGDGARLGGDIKVAAESHEQSTPDVASEPVSGRYLVAWVDYRMVPTRSTDVYARRIAAGGGGGGVGGDFRVGGAAAINSEWYPAVTYGSTLDQFLVVWSDRRWYATRNLDIVGRRVKG
ncbi:MAG: hypothetical protein ABIJ48_03055 [Actinomycetota bacterium]